MPELHGNRPNTNDVGSRVVKTRKGKSWRIRQLLINLFWRPGESRKAEAAGKFTVSVHPLTGKVGQERSAGLLHLITTVYKATLHRSNGISQCPLSSSQWKTLTYIDRGNGICQIVFPSLRLEWCLISRQQTKQHSGFRNGFKGKFSFYYGRGKNDTFIIVTHKPKPTLKNFEDILLLWQSPSISSKCSSFGMWHIAHSDPQAWWSLHRRGSGTMSWGLKNSNLWETNYLSNFNI
jgi:hypothetical protein